MSLVKVTLKFQTLISEICQYFLLKKSSSSDFGQPAGTGVISTTVGPLPGNWLAANMADLTPVLQVSLS